jgi:tetratricopeptide (TPR) repeat protein
MAWRVGHGCDTGAGPRAGYAKGRARALSPITNYALTRAWRAMTYEQELTNLDHIDRAVEQLDRLFSNECGPFCVQGDAGSGRRTFLKKLGEADPSVVVVELLDVDEPDALVAGVLQAAGSIDDCDWRKNVATAGVLKGASDVARRLCRESKRLAILIPDGWLARDRASDAGGRLVSIKDAKRLLCLWDGRRGHQTVFVTNDEQSLDNSGILIEQPPVRLDRPVARLGALCDDSRWRTYADHAARLSEAIEPEVSLSPIALRLAVAVAALGGASDVDELSRRIKCGRMSMNYLGMRLQALLQEASLLPPLRRFLLSRRSIPRLEIQRVTAIPEEHEPLLTECIGYGARRTRVSAIVREMFNYLLRGVQHEPEETRDELEEAHETLADYHETADGVGAVWDAEGDAVVWWMEKVHHLANAGERCADRWEGLEIPSKEFYWDRARHYSIYLKDHERAAQIYRQCVVDFPNDDYGWHYLGFNLDRAGINRSEAEEAYREAIRLDLQNPWWNGRLVIFLIFQGRARAARSEWLCAVDRVDRDGSRTQRSEWLARHFYFVVASAWLDTGHPEDARVVLEAVPDHIMKGSLRLVRLGHDILDALEAERLGESVYSSNVPIEQRWHAPRYLKEKLGSADLCQWFPGRIASTNEDDVRVVYAVPQDPENERRVVEATISREDWASWDGWDDVAPDQFVELGVYEGGQKRIVPVLNEVRMDVPSDPETVFSYLRKWCSLPRDS